MKLHGYDKHKCTDPWDGAPPWDIEIGEMLGFLIVRLEALMATMAELTAAVARNSDAEDAVIVYLKGIVQQLKDAQATGDPAAIAAAITAIDANTDKAAAAVVAGT